MNDLIIHLHIPKTGGTTLRDIVNRQYSNESILTIPTIGESKNIIETLSKDRINQLAIIQGHLKYGLHNNIDRSVKYFAIMREPVDRVLSSYYYVISQSGNPQNLSSAKKTMSIYEYINSGINPFLINGQTQLISGNTCSIDDPLIKSNKLFDTAKKNINNNFILTGTTERFIESILLFKKLLNWKAPYFSRANRTKNKPDYSKVKSEIRNFIKEHNQLDIDLYNYVNQSIDKKIIEAGSDFGKNLKRFKRINSIINPIFGLSRAKRFFFK